jgi:hypothetical protein
MNQQIIIRPDTIKKSVDSISGQHTISRDTFFVHREIVPFTKETGIKIDTAGILLKIPVADTTFFYSAKEIAHNDSSYIDWFPFNFSVMDRQLREESRTTLVKHLKDGDEMPVKQYNIDWILPVCMISAFLYAVLRATSGSVFQGLMRFISFRGINESGSRVTGELFQWESTLLNLVTFINLSLFVYLLTIKYDLYFPEIHGIVVWLICFAIVIATVTIRHFICLITGKASGEEEIFREYLVGIYQAYRIAGLIIFLIILLILYTTILPAEIFYFTGFTAIGILYVARVLRLFLIFINRHVSLFYLILYLCALEILPVVILVKYVTGLV